MARTLIVDGYVVCVGPTRQVLPDGFVAIEGSDIAVVVVAAQMPGRESFGEVIDAAGCIAIPNILAGLQLGMGVTIILVVAAEMIGGSAQGGIGYLLISSGQVMETEKVFANLVVVGAVGAVAKHRSGPDEIVR